MVTKTILANVNVTPELLAESFVEMDNMQQAKVLSMIWDGMKGGYETGGNNGAWNRAMQCAYIREALDTEAKNLLEELREPVEELLSEPNDAVGTSIGNEPEEGPQIIRTTESGLYTVAKGATPVDPMHVCTFVDPDKVKPYSHAGLEAALEAIDDVDPNNPENYTLAAALQRLKTKDALRASAKLAEEGQLVANYNVKLDSACDECFGTGLKGGFQAPCSKGCKP